MSRRAFTLIELLVVILIIALLVGISVAVGRTVIGGGKVGQTTNVIRALEVVLGDYTSSQGRIPDPYVLIPHTEAVYFPVMDGRNMEINDSGVVPSGYQMINSVGLFQFQMAQSQVSMEALEGLDAKFRRMYSPYSNPTAGHEIPTVFDAWGNPIRYVHPAWDGTIVGPDLDSPANPPVQGISVETAAPLLDVRLPSGSQWGITEVRRNNRDTGSPPERAEQFADSDGGVSANQRPYFYSAGPDGRVGFADSNGNGRLDPGETDYNADNVYTVKPLFRD